MQDTKGLSKSEARFRYQSLVQHAVDAIVSIDAHSKVLLWNPAAEKMFGYSASEAMGKDVATLIIPPEYQEAHRAGMKRLLKTGEGPIIGRTVEITGQRRDGSFFPVELSIFCTSPHNGKHEFTAIIRDHSVQKDLERQLQEQLSQAKTREQIAREITDSIRGKIDLNEILSLATRRLGEFTRADRCIIWLYDEEKRAFSTSNLEYCKEGECPVGGLSFPERPLFQDLLPWDEAVYIPDVSQLQSISDMDRILLQQRQTKSLAHIPLRHEEKFFGLLRIHSTYETCAWNEETISLLKSICANISAALYEAQQESDTRHELKARVRQQEIVNRLGREALLGTSLQEILASAVRLVAETLDVPYCKILERIFIHGSEQLFMRAGIGWDPELVGTTMSPTLEPHASCTITANEPVVVEDIETEKRFSPSALHRRYSLRSGASVVIYGVQAAYGVLEVDSPVRRRFNASEISFLQSVANVIGIVIERKQAENQAFLANERYRLVLDASENGIWDWDIETGDLFWSDQLFEMYGLDKKTFQPTLDNYQSILHPDETDMMMQKVHEHLENGTPYEVEFRIRHADGHYLYNYTKGKAIRDASGKPIRMLGLTIDITDRKRAEEELQRGLERERLSRRVLEITGQSFDIGHVLRSVAEEVGRHFGADRCILVRYENLDRQDKEFNITVSGQYLASPEMEQVKISDIPDKMWRFLTRNLPAHQALKLVNTPTRELYLADLENRLNEMDIPQAEHAEYLKYLKTLLFDRYRIQSNLRVGIQFRGRGYGAITLHQCTHPRIWTPEEVDLLQNIARLVGSALYQMELYEQEQQATRELEKSYHLINIISEAQTHFITNENIYQLFEGPLNRLLTLTESEYGFIGEILHTPEGKPYLKCNFLTNIAWDEETRRLYEESRLTGFEFHKLDNLFGLVLTSGEVVISNDPDHDPRSGGRPAGHPPLKAFLGMPFYKGDQLVGMVGIANRPGGYDEQLAEELQPFLDACGNIIIGYRNEQIRKKLTHDLKVNERALKMYASKLERSNRELEQFATIASHDLQAPLRKVILFSEYLRTSAGKDLPEESYDYIDRIQRATRRMQDLITDLLVLSRVTRKGKPFKPVDLGVIIQEVVIDLEEVIRETGGRVVIGDMMTIAADDTQMRQIFQNLIGNALKFHKPDVPPVIEIEAKPMDNRTCRIEVRDNGIGFDEKYLDRIFSVFERLHGESEYEGTGMGLAIVQKIVERHGGTVTASSQPDKGSTFVITLPIHQE